ncbi:MAG: hypothetical protein A2289_14310 [Deltaproteobacteria bacterium RIFOXYA12_FULL_58_15]|nr:MAG: hypothetical protein A2289_14310 [Deltaproteobacteria bacterium RIFOXYA12_FULL_58_15]OGR13992.1 MAG: hypothetical protein A2341_24740 [Deltaproteobacteria bacterium RIFOXYB12_FULL_58_9]
MYKEISFPLGLCLLAVACATSEGAPPAVSAMQPPVGSEPVGAGTPELSKLLVMPLRTESGLESQARALDEMLLAAVHGLNKYEVLGPTDLNAILGVEAMKDAMGCDDVSCAAEIGGALGAPFLLAGELRKLDTQAVLSLRLMDTQAPAVLQRSTARGPTDGESLAKIMTIAVGKLMQVEIENTGPEVATPEPMVDYGEFQAMTMALARRMSNNEYTAMLTDLDGYDTAKIVVPPNTDLNETLTFYRVLACYMLKRLQCVDSAGHTYLSRWPAGMYANTIQTYLDQLGDAELRRQSGLADAAKRVADLKALLDRGSLEERQYQESAAAIWYGAMQYDKAAHLYQQLVRAHTDDGAKMADMALMLSRVLIELGRFDEAKSVLADVERRHPDQYRLRGLHQQMRQLPK